MNKKSAIIYYSWIGNTEVVAKEIQRLTGYDLIKIQEKKERKLGNIMGPALCALLGLQSNIEPLDFSLADYDNVYLGTPVWAGKTTPAINRFISKANFKGKNIWIFITKADEKVPQKVIDSVKRRIEKKGGTVMDCLSLTTKWDPKTNIPTSVEDIRSDIQVWIEKATLN
jgi:flavodoxin